MMYGVAIDAKNAPEASLVNLASLVKEASKHRPKLFIERHSILWFCPPRDIPMKTPLFDVLTTPQTTEND